MRSVVFLRLKNGRWNQLNPYDTGFDQYLEYEDDERTARDKVNLLAMEIMWQLISQGVITPGRNTANPNLPWFHLTDYGKKVI
ncbi:MAG: hypothetical protein HWN66_17335 [Candidatus Helarchaeota archaeon]|nr:hypothetical protein [Candidatus Helarchaeota archaeon]